AAGLPELAHHLHVHAGAHRIDEVFAAAIPLDEPCIDTAGAPSHQCVVGGRAIRDARDVVCEVVARAAWNDAECGVVLALGAGAEQPVRDFVHGSVTANSDDHGCTVPCGAPGDLDCVARTRRIDARPCHAARFQLARDLFAHGGGGTAARGRIQHDLDAVCVGRCGLCRG